MVLGGEFWVHVAFGTLVASAGILVFALGPGRPSNQLLGLMLFVNGVGPVGILFALASAPTPSAAAAFASWQVSKGVILSTHHAYLLFLGQALDHAWTRWLRRPVWIFAIGGTGFVMFLQAALRPESTLTEPLGLVAMVLQLAIGVFAVAVAALVARSHPKHSGPRARARNYLLAFVAQDIALIGLPVISIIAASGTPVSDSVYLMFRSFFVISAILIIIALLRGQVVNMESRLHFTVSRTTIAAIFIAVAIGVQTAVSELVAGAWGWAAAGLAAMGLVFGLQPLQRAADRLADKAVPRGRRGVSMSHDERERLYAEQVQIAYSDGLMGAKERRTLANIRERLSLSAAQALNIEERVVAG